MKKILFIISLVLANILCIAQTNQFVAIGEQIWTQQNLNISKFRNGDLIKEAKSKEDWLKCGYREEPAWCYFKFDKNYANFGKLYNYYAISDKRNIAPVGWKIPTIEDYYSLVKYIDPLCSKFHFLSEGSLAGGSLKSTESLANLEVLEDLYQKAITKGFKGNKNDFIQKLYTNEALFLEMYNYVTTKGYKNEVNSFASLIGKSSMWKNKCPQINVNFNALPTGNYSPSIENSDFDWRVNRFEVMYWINTDWNKLFEFAKSVDSKIFFEQIKTSDIVDKAGIIRLNDADCLLSFRDVPKMNGYYIRLLKE